jgi:predicted nucleic acid-binding protein
VFLERVEAQEVLAHTTVQALADAIHKTMMVEAAARSGQQRTSLIGWLNKHPEVLGHLPVTREVARQILALSVSVLPTDPNLLRRAIELSGQHQLLTNDALILATMQRHGLTHLITNDDDFDRVPELTIWKPR